VRGRKQSLEQNTEPVVEGCRQEGGLVSCKVCGQGNFWSLKRRASPFSPFSLPFSCIYSPFPISENDACRKSQQVFKKKIKGRMIFILTIDYRIQVYKKNYPTENISQI